MSKSVFCRCTVKNLVVKMPETGYLLCQWLQIGYRFSFIKNTLRGLPRPDALRPACSGLHFYDDKAKAALAVIGRPALVCMV